MGASLQDLIDRLLELAALEERRTLDKVSDVALDELLTPRRARPLSRSRTRAR